MFFTCASGYAIYFIYFVAEMRTYLHNREHTLYQNFWRCTIHYNLRERFVSLVWVVAVTLCLMTISTRLYSVIAIGVLLVLGWMYQYIHHCHEYRSHMSRIPELDWVQYPDSDDDADINRSEQRLLTQQDDSVSEVEVPSLSHTSPETGTGRDTTMRQV